ncbi:ATP synthase F0 subunit B [Candidatus Gottesmanbacteria bacterium RBG_16_52_11]|uniref:ATP synthase subunit b n=1 Tax=Candidatus Gottesmanbacteria bacterium RBG_16_52_11 TaxID=1798374 RepID=A0A1F5YQB5_9BACT|nr:MAG: ATP synthase F0 subunit B [Candidatus Gottesmanbacteria bacterium RBG_16_52_11]
MEALGVQPILLLAQIINFVIIMAVLKKLLYKPVIRFLAKRKQEIQTGLELSQKMKEEDEKLKEKQKKMLETARVDALEIINKAKKDAKADARKILEDAQSEASRMMEKRREEMEDEYRVMQKKLQSETVDLAAAMVERILPSLITRDGHRKLLENQLKQLKQ